MKIINFKNFLPFKKLREKMGIAKDYQPNFKSTEAVIEAMKWEEIKTRGLDIDIKELIVAKDGTLEHKDFPGQKMIVYIRDFESGYGGKPKFHVSWCNTLKSMTESGKYSRYVVSQRNDGIFLLNRMKWGKITGENSEEELDVCKNCLSKLNYNRYNTYRNNMKLKEKIVDDFTIKDFLEEYNTDIKIEPKYNPYSQPKNIYPKDWKKISLDYRKMKDWTCEECGRKCEEYSSELHVHHINGNKFDCSPSNLQVLCLECHKRKPYHGHMKNNPLFKEIKY